MSAFDQSGHRPLPRMPSPQSRVWHEDFGEVGAKALSLCRKDKVRLPPFFFLPPLFSQKKFSKKTFPPRVILANGGEADDSQSIAGAGRRRSDRCDDIEL